jgi:outer membrane protein OmpA-like peptidoglycan-associated protein
MVGRHALSCALLLLGVGAAPARAQQLDALRIRAMLGGGLMVSSDQVNKLGYDTFGLLAGTQVGYAMLPWLDLELAVMGAAFPTSAGTRTGALVSPMIGVSAGTLGQSIRPYAQLDVGPGYSGALLRPFFRAGIGVDFRVASAIALGPILGYGDLFERGAPGNSTDARFAWLGVSVSFRPGALMHVQPAPPQSSLRTVVLQGPGILQQSPPARTVEPSPGLLELVDRAVPKPQLELLAPVLFQFDSDELEPIGVAMLHEVARELARRSDIELLEIEGYADSRGSADYNANLSARRANRVLQWLVEHGVERTRLQVAAKGAAEPVEEGANEQDYEQNRRVVFRVLQTKAVGEQ